MGAKQTKPPKVEVSSYGSLKLEFDKNEYTSGDTVKGTAILTL